MMKYPNVVWAIEKKRLAHYELAVQVKIERTRLSRCLHGVSQFTPSERQRIANTLGFDQAWLFETPKPPRRRILEGEAPAEVAASVSTE